MMDPKLTVEEIARRFPEALKVFERHRVDLCCGGRLPLEEVARKHGLDLARILKELEAAISART